MRRLNRFLSAMFFLSQAVCSKTSVAQPESRRLPQAAPGGTYAAQLALPPGLGYPFAHCEMSGRVPRWLTLDCSRLQLRGKVPAKANEDDTYQLTLQVEDSDGNVRSFPLELRISAKPELVSLGEPEPAPMPARSASTSLSNRHSHAVGATTSVPTSAPSLEQGTSFADPDAKPGLPIGGVEDTAEENEQEAAPASTEGGKSRDSATFNASSPAGTLQNAVAEMRETSVTAPASRSVRPRSSLRTSAPESIHPLPDASRPANCAKAIPPAAGPHISEEIDAMHDLDLTLDRCGDDRKAKPCLKALTDLQKEATNTTAALASCSLYGKSTAEDLDEKMKTWYGARSELWQNFAVYLKSHSDDISKGSLDLRSEWVGILKDAHAQKLPPDMQSISPSETPAILGTINAGDTSFNVLVSGKASLVAYSVLADDDSKGPRSCHGETVQPPGGLRLSLKTSATDSALIPSVEVKGDSTPGLKTIYLKEPLIAGAQICVAETKDEPGQSGSASGKRETSLRYSQVAVVKDSLDWGRVRAYFVGGALISNNQSSFSSSSANQFLDLNVDKFWIIPDCAMGLDAQGNCKKKPFHRWPGMSTYFDTRLTAIPIAIKTATTTTVSGTTTTAPADNTLTTQKTARVQGAAYFPYVLTNWTYNNSGNALYVGAIAKVGFDTLTGSTNPVGVLNNSAVGDNTVQANLNRVYNFYSFGARVGHFGLYPTRSKSPELLSYFDINFGPYSNLESYICKPGPQGWPVANPDITKPVSDCGDPNGPLANLKYASNKRIWRLDLEGLLKIPATPLVIGFNANIGQRAVGAYNLDTRRVPADDVRFLFGTKFDIATVMKRLGVGQ